MEVREATKAIHALTENEVDIDEFYDVTHLNHEKYLNKKNEKYNEMTLIHWTRYGHRKFCQDL
ncbi:unnamed protein product, partial [Dovyalis caffra]